jgi:biopolymer transport protein ExbB
MESLFLNAYDYLQQGGWIMIPLGVTSLVMWALIIERLITFRNMTHLDIPLDMAIRAVRIEPREFYGSGLRTQLVRGFLSERSGIPLLDSEILEHSAMKLRSALRRYLAVIAVLASIAPLLGLLGTVLGMIATFDVISLFGTGNAKAMAGGISVALVTTQTGLLIAIPGLFLSGLLNRKASQLQTRLDEVTTILRRAIRQPDRVEAGVS